MLSFGERLKTAFRGAKNIQIARELGVSESAVSNYVGGRVPDVDLLGKITKSTNCNLHWLLTGEGDPFLDAEPEDFISAFHAEIRSTVLRLLDDESNIDAQKVRDIFRRIIKEEISNQTSRLVVPLEVGNADDEKTRKTG